MHIQGASNCRFTIYIKHKYPMNLLYSRSHETYFLFDRSKLLKINCLIIVKEFIEVLQFLFIVSDNKIKTLDLCPK